MEENVCQNCPRACKVNRKAQEGFCHEKVTIRIAKIIDNFFWEEPCLQGEKGACAIFFSGCNLQCDYCQNHEISRGHVGKIVSVEEFVALLKEKEKTSSYIDLVTPTHFSGEIIKALTIYKPKVPVIYNTSGYESLDILKKLTPLVDIMLIDLKYANNNLGEKYSNCKNYFEVASKALGYVCKAYPDEFLGQDMQKGVVIRHLVLPTEVQNSLDVLSFLVKYRERKISVMSQFTPNGKSSINRKLTPLEYKVVLAHMEKMGFENGYFQDFGSASDAFVPNFKCKCD